MAEIASSAGRVSIELGTGAPLPTVFVRRGVEGPARALVGALLDYCEDVLHGDRALTIDDVRAEVAEILALATSDVIVELAALGLELTASSRLRAALDAARGTNLGAEAALRAAAGS